ncbi:uncharacterized protein [Spinacia oleracea]|uniref:TAF1C beta-propeller domain-containing protein n=1 Tax=Spinacia oleracea TaxID=3562 RepID=A0A9R0JP89_SPIOL|nr:uncharacterized protein LOC110782154 [Spinacia oleracea]
MQYSEEWKSLFPISSVHSPPLLLTQNPPLLGPLFFNPVPESLSLLFSSPDLSPPFLPPPPHLSLPKFLKTSTYYDSPVLPTAASAISASFTSEEHSTSSNSLPHNRLEPLYCPNNQVFIFFPTGSNLDRVGFLVLSVRDSKLVVDFCSDGSVLTSQKFDHRIVQLTACSLTDCSFPDVGGSACVGFLLACNMYAANWFSVRTSVHCLDSKKPALVLMGSKKFTSSMVAYACWSPHLPGECVILLESGALFLFDMDSCLETRFRGKRISVAWDELGESASSGWFSCEFSWHPRILVVANSKAIYVLDLRFGKCHTICLLRIDLLGESDLHAKDRFVVFSKAGSDGFFYTVASEQWLFLCDIRKPLMPVLRWAHHLREPRYMTVLSLSELRSMPHDKNAGASAVILGSFWNDDFSVFCYGRPHPTTTKSLSSKISKFSNSFYAWELPSPFLLASQNCHCGSCLLREEFAKDDLLDWIVWQQKRESVLGFCIFNRDLCSLFPKAGEHGGFTLLRLMSTGKLESQQYCASWKIARNVATAHGEVTPLKDSLLCSMGDETYKFTRRFRYIKLENLYNHLNNNLAKLLFTKFRDIPATAGVKKRYNKRFQKFMSEKMKSFGCDPPMSHLSIADVFRDVDMPTNLYEIVSRVMWTSLPMNILEVAFPEYNEVLEVEHKKFSPDFPAIPDQDQSPPFFLRDPSRCTNKWSNKVRCSEDFLGPVFPLPALVVLNEISRRGYSFVGEVNEFSPEDIFSHQCKYVMRLTKEMGILNVGDKQDKEHAVSLKEDRDEILDDFSEPRPLFLYKPSAFLDEVGEQAGSVLGERYNTVVSKFAEDDGDFFAGLCPMELKFDSDKKIQKFSDEESHVFNLLKKQCSRWQNGFMPYQNLHMQLREKQPHLRPDN